MPVYKLGEMTWREIRDALNTVEVAIIPVGAHEQHGPHLTENCDAVLAEKMAEKLGKRMHPYTVVTPTINMGISTHHLSFPGTITLQPETLLALIRDIIMSLKVHGLKKFFLLNAHGGNQPLLGIASTTLSVDLNVDVYYAKTTAGVKSVIDQHVVSAVHGHSCEREVSEALYLAPEIVRKDKVEKGEVNKGGRWEQLRPGKPIQGFYRYEEMTANGAIGDASSASRETGKQIIEAAVNQLSEELTVLIGLESQILQSK